MNHRLQELSPTPLEIHWHENKSTYIAVRRTFKGFQLKLHRLFFDAPTPVLEAILDFALKRDAGAKKILRQMAQLHFAKNASIPRELSSKGKVYDLQEIFDRVNKQFELVDVVIGWSNKVPRGKFRSMTFGCFDSTCRQIRIHPLLDDEEVPLYFIEFIVYHEALHAICPPRIDGQGRCLVHTKEFREKEKEFPQFKQAKEWEKTSLQFFKKRRG